MNRHVLIACCALLFGACSAGAPTPTAQAATSSLQADLTHDGACYARTYDTAHLAAHPQQTVTNFFVGAAGPEWRSTETAGHFAVSFGFRITGRGDLYSGAGMCAPNGEALSCDVEGDGGAFTIARNGDGLRITLRRLEVEGARDFSPDLAAGDNRVMLLSPAEAGACAVG
jgi:hypothetical protein